MRNFTVKAEQPVWGGEVRTIFVWDVEPIVEKKKLKFAHKQ